MEVISKTFELRNKEQLPQILMRIFNVCKTDPSFPLKGNVNSIELEIEEVHQKLEKKNKVLLETTGLRDELSNRLQELRKENFELKSRLLEELGSEL
jgi:hypothetical protein